MNVWNMCRWVLPQISWIHFVGVCVCAYELTTILTAMSQEETQQAAPPPSPSTITPVRPVWGALDQSAVCVFVCVWESWAKYLKLKCLFLCLNNGDWIVTVVAMCFPLSACGASAPSRVSPTQSRPSCLHMTSAPSMMPVGVSVGVRDLTQT